MAGYTKMPKKTLEKLMDDLERSHVHTMNANTRALQYAGFATGTKARERAEFWQDEFDATLAAMRTTQSNFTAALNSLIEMHAIDGEGKSSIRWYSDEEISKRLAKATQL